MKNVVLNLAKEYRPVSSRDKINSAFTNAILIIELEDGDLPWLVTAITDDGEIGRWYHASKATALSTATYEALTRDLPILIELNPSDACSETYEVFLKGKN
jgi:hypothetical protein